MHGLLRDFFEFSNAIGAFVIYVLIRSMDSSSIRLEANRRIQYNTSQLWIDKALSQIIPYLLPVFKEYMGSPLSSHFAFQSEKDWLEFFTNWHSPSYKFNEKVIEQLLDSLRQLYPKVYHNLERVTKDIPKEIDSMKHHAEYLKNKKEYQRHIRS